MSPDRAHVHAPERLPDLLAAQDVALGHEQLSGDPHADQARMPNSSTHTPASAIQNRRNMAVPLAGHYTPQPRPAPSSTP
jgi:hypothetical protein